MLEPNAQSRYVQSCADAAFGYFAAASSAWMEAAKRPMEFWGSTLEAMAPKPEPRSWYRHPDERKPAPLPTPFWPMSWGPAAATPMQAWFAAPPAGLPMAMAWPANLLSPWLAMMSSPRAMTAWPMAMMMISFGVPESVARPAADANAAALDATRIASEAIDRAFSAYRSEGGHASAQVIGGRKLMTAFLPFSGLPFLN